MHGVDLSFSFIYMLLFFLFKQLNNNIRLYCIYLFEIRVLDCGCEGVQSSVQKSEGTAEKASEATALQSMKL